MTLRKGEDTAFYNGLLKERYKGDKRDRKTRKKT
jgi:hypothetical protein